ncbi:hypothetical protein [Natranaerobius thermophilus]|uniref:Uncharacterized protein n=1 Tax=Natranaerobius thermophilus (strain ATCC BAA-1301 / DSM 18059 / JW/NM-WN-LF) TaxID=457570 RepID=B2A5K9_NATTJ|nr:hypothetical protein [Natranaerobius thermophilus]ACB85364.1 conserved hypothetical protein [Natranaerobius thermophilus JW/NM-WN-LF]
MRMKWNKEINELLIKAASVIEKFVALALLVGVVLGLYLYIVTGNFYQNFFGENIYDNFRNFISLILIFVIALELSEMLLIKRPGTIVEIFFLAIARKLLVYTENTYELVLGVIALAGVFMIRKYLFIDHFEPYESVIVGGNTFIKDANKIAGVNILQDPSETTINQLLHKLSEEERRQLVENLTFTVGDAKLTILDMNQEFISKVRIKRLNN